jgi:hypothetical protein
LRRWRPRLAAVLPALLLPLLAGCGRSPAGEEPPPEHFRNAWSFTGSIEGRPIAGVIRFIEHDVFPLAYTVTGDVGPCRNYLRSLSEPRIFIDCDGLFIGFVQSGRVLQRTTATLRTLREVEREECWAYGEDAGGRPACTEWRTVRVTEPVVYSGWVELRRLADIVAAERPLH